MEPFLVSNTNDVHTVKIKSQEVITKSVTYGMFKLDVTTFYNNFQSASSKKLLN